LVLAELLDESLILLKQRCGSKEELLEAMVDKVVQTGNVNNKRELLKIIMEREKAASTGFGRGVAIPHGTNKVGDRVITVFARVDHGVDFGALDGKPVHLVFLLVTPEKDITSYLTVLAQLSRVLRKESFRKRLLQCQTAAEIVQAFREKN
jgi:fructose-specific phosphotransferase system IIA component